MRAKGTFISTLLVIDTFLVSYAAGFNSRHALVVDPSLPPLPPVKSSAKITPANSAGKSKDEASGGSKEHTDKDKPTEKTSTSKKHSDAGTKTSEGKDSKSKKKKRRKSKVSADK